MDVEKSLIARRLLSQPFDFSLAFDEALKRAVEGIGGERSRQDKIEDVVSLLYSGSEHLFTIFFRSTTAPTLEALGNSLVVRER